MIGRRMHRKAKCALRAHGKPATREKAKSGEREGDAVSLNETAKITAMPENMPDAHNSNLSNQQRVEKAESSNQNSFEQYKGDRKSTRLNSSHVAISYAVFCLKKKRKIL